MAKKIVFVSGFVALALLGILYFYSRELEFAYVADTAQTPLSPTETRRLKAIHLDCFADVYRKQLSGFYREKYEMHTPSQLANLEATMDTVMVSYREGIEKKFKTIKNLYVVRLADEIIGEFSCQTDNDFTNGDPILYDVCLAPEQRGKGYGSTMTEYAVNHCSKPGHPLVLTVYKDQDKLIKMYAGLGFEIVPFEKPADDTFRYYNKHLMRFTARNVLKK
jgi:ribosomal protein S18 acetylase RimI-like enzyme